MVKEQIEIEILTGNFKMHLTSHKGKACSKFQQKAGDMSSQPPLHLPLMRLVTKTEEVEQVGIFQGLLRQVRLWRRQCAFKVGGGFAVSFVRSALNLHLEDAATPTVFDGFLRGLPRHCQ